jgi:hypothetical protein
MPNPEARTELVLSSAATPRPRVTVAILPAASRQVQLTPTSCDLTLSGSRQAFETDARPLTAEPHALRHHGPTQPVLACPKYTVPSAYWRPNSVVNEVLIKFSKKRLFE